MKRPFASDHDCILTSDLFSQSHQRIDLGLSQSLQHRQVTVILNLVRQTFLLASPAADEFLGESGAAMAGELVAVRLVPRNLDRPHVFIIVACGVGRVAGIGAGSAMTMRGCGYDESAIARGGAVPTMRGPLAGL